MFEKIIVALNTTENYTALFDKALSLAQVTGAKLKIVSVLAPHYGYGTPFRDYPISAGYAITMEDSYWDAYQQQYAELKEDGFRTLSLLSDQARMRGVQTEFFQKNGEPGAVICELADSEKADLVIVGSHGRRGLEEFMAGSVSSYVMHRAPCSVMIVHRLAQNKSLPQKIAATATL